MKFIYPAVSAKLKKVIIRDFSLIWSVVRLLETLWMT